VHGVAFRGAPILIEQPHPPPPWTSSSRLRSSTAKPSLTSPELNGRGEAGHFAGDWVAGTTRRLTTRGG
jgi:hypothetical protein